MELHRPEVLGHSFVVIRYELRMMEFVRRLFEQTTRCCIVCCLAVSFVTNDRVLRVDVLHRSTFALDFQDKE